MNLFQLLAITVLAVLFVLSATAMVRGWATRREGLIWSSVWLATGVAIALPDLTIDIARALGIGRGADLVLYCAVIVMLVGFFMVYARLRRLRRDLTVLTRQLAIRDAINPNPLNDRSPAPTSPSRREPNPTAGPPDGRN